MSLILEALRKSEAERQRGRAPGLFVAQAPLAPRRRGPPAWAWALGALLLAGLASAAWLAWQRSPAPGTTGAAAAAAEPRTAADAPAAAPFAATAPANRPAATVVPSPAPMPEPAPMAMPMPAPAPGPQRNAGVPAAPADEAATLSAWPATAPASEPAPAPAPSPAATGPAAAAPAPLPTLAQLPAGARAQLPPLKLSMHVYAQAPAQRFVILDGQRLGEGASPAPGVVVQEIRRDGLVLSVNGEALLLTRP